jgi:hypothetical protein
MRFDLTSKKNPLTASQNLIAKFVWATACTHLIK